MFSFDKLVDITVGVIAGKSDPITQELQKAPLNTLPRLRVNI